ACGATARGGFGARRGWIQSPHGSRRGRQSDKAVRTAPCRRCGGRPSRTLMDWIQHDHRYLALGLELIVGVGRPKFERLFPKSETFLARRYPGPRVHLLGPDLYLDVGVRENILIPTWVLGRASLRGDDEVTTAIRSVKQGEYELVARLATGGRQQQRRRGDLASLGQRHLVHVP